MEDFIGHLFSSNIQIDKSEKDFMSTHITRKKHLISNLPVLYTIQKYSLDYTVPSSISTYRFCSITKTILSLKIHQKQSWIETTVLALTFTQHIKVSSFFMFLALSSSTKQAHKVRVRPRISFSLLRGTRNVISKNYLQNIARQSI